MAIDSALKSSEAGGVTEHRATSEAANLHGPAARINHVAKHELAAVLHARWQWAIWLMWQTPARLCIHPISGRLRCHLSLPAQQSAQLPDRYRSLARRYNLSSKFSLTVSLFPHQHFSSYLGSTVGSGKVSVLTTCALQQTCGRSRGRISMHKCSAGLGSTWSGAIKSELRFYYSITCLMGTRHCRCTLSQ